MPHIRKIRQGFLADLKHVKSGSWDYETRLIRLSTRCLYV